MKKCLLAMMLALALLTGCSGNIQGNNADTEKQTNDLNVVNQTKNNTGSSKNTTKEYATPKMEGKISVSAMSEQEFLMVAAKQFMAKYPKVKVNINTYRGISKDAGENPPDEYKTENYRSFLNTKIMTGKAEDIIFTANLPVKKYIDMGVFEDLSNYLSNSKEINSENYYMNVLESPRDTNGKLYILPLACHFEVISFNSKLISESNSKLDTGIKTISYEKASEFAQKLLKGTSKKNAYITQENVAQFFYYLVTGNPNQFIDIEKKQASIDTDEYINLLNQTKNLVGKGFFLKDNFDFYNTEYYLAFKTDRDVQAAFYSLDSSSGDCYAMPMSDAAGNVLANPNFSLGINSASKNKELAWEFVKFLLSDEIQSSPSFYFSLSVNKKGFEASVERAFKFYDKGKGKASKDSYKSLLEKWTMQINAYDTSDPVIEEFFFEENRKFFEGIQSAKETARILHAKVNKYFNE